MTREEKESLSKETSCLEGEVGSNAQHPLLHLCASVSRRSARALRLCVTLLLGTLAAVVAAAQPPPPAADSIAISTYLPELQRLQQAADWVGLERAARQASSALSEHKGPDSADAVTASIFLAKAFEGQGRYAEAEPLYQRALAFREKSLGPDHPDVAASLNDLGNLLWAQGQYARSEPLFQRALQIREKALGPNHPDVATSLNNLAALYQAQGQYVKAEPLYLRALDIREKSLGPNHPAVATSLNNLAALYQAQGQYVKAEPLYQRALGIREKALGPDHPVVAQSLNNLAALYQAQGQYATAEPLLQRALHIREKALGPNHPDVGQNLNALADLYQAWGQYAKAEPLYLRALDIREKSLGPNHPDVATSLSNLALLYSAQGQYVKAEPLYQRALDIREKALGPNHPAVATSLNNLAGLYRVQGQYAKAEPLFQRALDIREKALGPNHPDVATSLNNLAELYRVQGQYAKAEPLYQRALDIREKALGPNHPDVATSLNNLGGLYWAQGQYAKAEPLFQRALQIREKAFGPNHPDVATSLNNLAELYRVQGRHAEAEALYHRSVAIWEKNLGPDHPDLANGLDNLAGLYREQGQYAEAEPLLRRGLEIREKALGPDHPDVAASLDNLAELYREQSEYAKAEPPYQRALEIRERTLGPDHPAVANSLNNLAVLYWMEGQYAKAEPLYQRALEIREKVLGFDHPEVADSLNNLGVLYWAQGKYAKAEPLHEQALGIWEKILGRDHPNVAECLNNLAEDHEAQGHYARAEASYQRALGILEKTLGPDHPDTTITRENLAYSELLQGRFDQAAANYRLACPARFSAVRSGNQRSEAVQAVQTSAARCSTFHALSLWGWSAQGGGTASADRPDALKLEAFEASQRAVQSAAGTAMARSAALTAANSAGVGPEARDYEAALLEREHLDEEYAKAVGTSGPQSIEKRQGLAKARDQVLSRIMQLAAVLQTRAPLYWDYRAPAPVSVTALQAAHGPDSSLLRENEALIAWLVPPGKDRGLVFAVSKQKAAWARIGVTGNELRAAVVRLRQEIDPEGYALRGMEIVGTSPALPEASASSAGETPSMSTSTTWAAFDRHSAYELYQVLLGDASIQAVITDKAVLLFVPSGPLTALPPGLLVTAAASGGTEKDIDPAALRATAWLLRSKAVALLPAVSSLRTLRQILPTGHDTSDPLLAFADPEFTVSVGESPTKRAVRTPRSFNAYFRNGIPLADAMESLPALPGTRIEAEALRRALAAPSASLLVGRNASKAQLMARNADGRLAKVRVLEFATHGLVAGDISQVAEPGLVLAAGSKPEDALLLASEASTLRLKADWVLLSACNTASPDAPEAQGLSGLSRAFFYAGARSLLVSHWLVRDDVAPILIPAVLKGERDDPHLSRAEALRKASLAILDDPHLNAASPAAWAAFTLIGEAGRD